MEYGAVDLLSPKGPEYGAGRYREIPIMDERNLILLIVSFQVLKVPRPRYKGTIRSLQLIGSKPNYSDNLIGSFAF